MRFVDVNVLVYAHRTDAPDHDRYRNWLFDALTGEEALGVADSVLVGFIRVTTHPRIFRDPTPLPMALRVADMVRRAPATIVLSPSDRTWETFQRMAAAGEATGNLAPDAYLAAQAMEHGATLITADRGFGRFGGLQWKHPLDP